MTWQNIRSFLSKKTGKPEEYFELLCDYYIVEYCVEGISNEQISELLNLDLQTVQEVLEKRINFSGFVVSLPFSPRLWYNCINEINDSKYSNDVLIGIVKKFYEIKEKIEEYECDNSRF